jgi:hypothetical protein
MLNSSIQISKPEDVINAANKWANEVFSRPKTKDYRAVKQMENEYDDALEALEKSMMALLEGSDDEDDEDCDEEGNFEDMEDYGMQLMISDDGERSFATDIDIAMASISSLLENHPSMDVEPPLSHQDDLDTLDMSYSLADMALDDSAILEDLSNVDLKALRCAQPPTDSASDASMSASFLLPSLLQSNSNLQATAMLDLLRAEDLYVDALIGALNARISRADLEPYLSRSARERVFGQIPRPLTAHVAEHEQNIRPPLRLMQRPRQHSISDQPIQLPPVTNPLLPRVLPGFDLQKKSKRHPSHGLR